MLRFDPARPFSRGDVAFMRLIAPSVGRALRASLDRERALAQAGAEGELTPVAGVLILGVGGRIQFHTPAAERWLSILREMERDTRAALPLVVLSVVAGARRGMPALIRLPTPIGPLRIEATVGSEVGTVAVVFTRETPPASPAIPAAWPLTPQERAVVVLLLRGLDNRGLAAHLNRSENTVETHLRHIYEKLGLHSRTELFARFFRETHAASTALPGLPEACE